MKNEHDVLKKRQPEIQQKPKNWRWNIQFCRRKPYTGDYYFDPYVSGDFKMDIEEMARNQQREAGGDGKKPGTNGSSAEEEKGGHGDQSEEMSAHAKRQRTSRLMRRDEGRVWFLQWVHYTLGAGYTLVNS